MFVMSTIGVGAVASMGSWKSMNCHGSIVGTMISKPYRKWSLIPSYFPVLSFMSVSGEHDCTETKHMPIYEERN